MALFDCASRPVPPASAYARADSFPEIRNTRRLVLPSPCDPRRSCPSSRCVGDREVGLRGAMCFVGYEPNRWVGRPSSESGVFLSLSEKPL